MKKKKTTNSDEEAVPSKLNEYRKSREKLNNERKEARIDEEMDKNKIRVDLLGMDRYFNRYWWFGSQSYVKSIPKVTPQSASCIYVEYHQPNVDINKVDSTEEYIEDMDVVEE